MLTNCTFVGNSCDGDGGGMRAGPGTSPTLIGCTFVGNRSNLVSISLGGGALFANQSTPSIIDCTFIANTSFVGGGAIYAQLNASVSVVNSVFAGNSASVDGGAIQLKSGSVVVATNSLFTGNHAGAFGGALYSDAGAGGAVIISNCTLANNTAGNNCGGILANTGHLDLGNSIVWFNEGCEVNWHGGATVDIDYNNIEALFQWEMAGRSMLGAAATRRSPTARSTETMLRPVVVCSMSEGVARR